MSIRRIAAVAAASVFGVSLLKAWPVINSLTSGPGVNPRGMSLISRSIVDPLVDAEDLLDEIDIQAGAPVATRVMRDVAATEYVSVPNRVHGHSFRARLE